MSLNILHNQELLKKVPLFKSLSIEELGKILDAPENGIEEYESKQTIIRESDIGNCMYVILEGTAEVSLRGDSSGRDITITTLRAGDFFGEQALLHGGTGRRNASVRSYQPCKVFRIDKKHVLLHIKLDDDTTKPTEINPNTPGNEVLEVIMKMRLFETLTRDELLAIDEWTKIITVGPGEFVLKESETAEYLYVVLEGLVEVFTLDQDGRIVILANHKPGSYFGEQALLSDDNDKRNSYVRTDGESRLIQIPKEYFRIILRRDDTLEGALKEIGVAQKDEIEKIKGQ